MSASILNRIIIRMKKRGGYIPLLYTNTSYKNWWLTELSLNLNRSAYEACERLFLLFFVASRIPKISSATNAAKLIINSNAASIDKNAPFVKVHRIHRHHLPLTQSHRHTTFIGNSFSITYWCTKKTFYRNFL